MSPRQFALLLLVAAVVCIGIGIYYFIPGVYHVLTFNGDPNARRTTHALLFFGLAVLGVLGAWILSGSKASKAKKP
jgi:uncharacterized membrane protein